MLIVCGEKNKLEAHHLDSYNYHPNKRYDIDNGVTLCRKHHTMFHCDFKRSFRQKATKKEFEDFIKLVKEFKDIGKKEYISSSH